MERVEASELTLERKRGGVLNERLVNFDDPERGPLVCDRRGRAKPGDEPDNTNRPDEPARHMHQPSARCTASRTTSVAGSAT
ncbi:MAG: hypothetical protein M3N47_02090 [Chloroflexota bacterium]|nr:hypothetical protein [Chloroflexota bacterium]